MKAKRWYRRRRSVECLWIGQTRKRLYPCKQATPLCAPGFNRKPHLSEALGQTADQMVHMDMAAAILRALFGKDTPSKPCPPSNR